MNLESNINSPLVESEKGGFGERKNGEWFRKSVGARFFGLFLFFFDKEPYRGSLEDALETAYQLAYEPNNTYCMHKMANHLSPLLST